MQRAPRRALAAAGVLVAQRGSAATVAAWLIVETASVGCALAWAYLFYVPHAMWAAAWALGCAALLTAALVGISWTVTRVGAVALVPYLVWVGLATSLAVGYAVLNPTAT